MNFSKFRPGFEQVDSELYELVIYRLAPTGPCARGAGGSKTHAGLGAFARVRGRALGCSLHMQPVTPASQTRQLEVNAVSTSGRVVGVRWNYSECHAAPPTHLPDFKCPVRLRLVCVATGDLAYVGLWVAGWMTTPLCRSRRLRYVSCRVWSGPPRVVRQC